MKVIVEALPTNIEEFQNLEIWDLSSPENTCTLFLLALDLFVKDQDLGVEAVNLLKGPVTLNNYEIQFLRDRLIDKPYLPLAYFEGANPSNNYQPNEPFTLYFYPDGRPQDVQEGYVRLYVQTTGADSKRFIKLRQKDNHWYLWEYPGILMDIRKPHEEDPWA